MSETPARTTEHVTAFLPSSVPDLCCPYETEIVMKLKNPLDVRAELSRGEGGRGGVDFVACFQTLESYDSTLKLLMFHHKSVWQRDFSLL